MMAAEGRNDRVDAKFTGEFTQRLSRDAVEVGDAVWRYACAGVVPRCVVSPDSVAGVQEAVRVGVANKLRFVPCGNGTHLYIGASPTAYDAALSTRRMDRVLRYEAGDMTVTAEAGLSLQSLNAHLESAGQWLPLDPPYSDEVTLGGVIAADRNGPLRLAYGKVRDLLLGVKVVTANAEQLKGGGSVVKNVAGYDIPKLFIGSLGTLGVIVEASFRLWPRPAACRLFFVPLGSVSEAIERGLGLLEKGLVPVQLEAVNGNAGEALGLGVGGLVIGFAGTESEMEMCQRRLAGELAEAQLLGDEEAVAVRKALAAFPQPMSEDAVVARVNVLPNQLAHLLKKFEAETADRGALLEVAAHAGNGVAWCQLAGPLSPLDFALCVEWMRMQTRALGGWLVVEAYPLGLQGHVDPWGFSESTVPLMRRIKRALDPNGMFAPGRFVGGI